MNTSDPKFLQTVHNTLQSLRTQLQSERQTTESLRQKLLAAHKANTDLASLLAAERETTASLTQKQKHVNAQIAALVSRLPTGDLDDNPILLPLKSPSSSSLLLPTPSSSSRPLPTPSSLIKKAPEPSSLKPAASDEKKPTKESIAVFFKDAARHEKTGHRIERLISPSPQGIYNCPCGSYSSAEPRNLRIHTNSCFGFPLQSRLKQSIQPTPNAAPSSSNNQSSLNRPANLIVPSKVQQPSDAVDPPIAPHKRKSDIVPASESLQAAVAQTASKKQKPEGHETVSNLQTESNAIILEMMPSYIHLPLEFKAAIDQGIQEFLEELGIPVEHKNASDTSSSFLIPDEVVIVFKKWLYAQLQPCFPDAEFRAP
ncbi:hypothetical protein HDU98_007966 [Podochytrium sp. JEL0797]|nr:hypothetical protein HDU98_007966 [Podochytrium sp. JEL0797]